LEFSALSLNASPELSSDWTISGTDRFGPLTDTISGSSFDDQLSESCLMDFLSEFRSVHFELAQSTDFSEVAVSSSRRLAVPEEPAAFLDDPYAGSPEKVAEDWWLASDGRWYAPELHPDLQIEQAWQPEPEPDSHPGDAHPDMSGGKARRSKLRGRLRSTVDA
jgi:hypothetical protein